MGEQMTKNPVICAECQYFVDVFTSPKCEKTGKRVYNSKPDWCPLPLWVEDEVQMSFELYEE